MIKDKELDPKILLEKEELLKLHLQGLKEIENLEVRDLVSIWGFMKILMTDKKDKDDIVYITNENSVIYKYRDAIQANTIVKIRSTKEFMEDNS